jgi:hypothetical protein
MIAGIIQSKSTKPINTVIKILKKLNFSDEKFQELAKAVGQELRKKHGMAI